MLKNCFLTFCLLWGCLLSFGQNVQKMQVWQDSLFQLGQKVFAQTAEVERIESNFLFVKTLVSALKEINSYYYDFDKLNMISAVRSPDDNFRIFTWNVPLQDGSYLYYGSIQFKSGNLKLIPLLDKTFEITDIHTDMLNNNQWYGAQFSDNSHIARKIFSYAKQATMLVRYNKNENRIEFDHLVPLEGGKKDQNIPDLSHDAYILRKNDLALQKNITILNLEQ
jgi:hypothetical protein